MINSINNFVSSTQNGLFLIDMPTGTGKTYLSIDYIFKNYKKLNKIFYITSLKKNVNDAYIELQNRFEEANMIDEFNKNVLKIGSNADNVIENITDLKINQNDKIMQFKSFIELRKNINLLKDNSNLTPELKEKFINEIREKYEPEFRRDLKKYINGKCKNKKEKKEFIDKNHPWLINLYPSILTMYRKIFFLTVDKFYLGNDTIIEPSYKFVDNRDIINNSVIFIDEIDATKNTILNRQIDESLKNRVDYIQLFLEIHSTLNNKEFPKVMLKNASSENKNPEEIIIKMKDVFNEVFLNHSMKYAFKNNDIDSDRKYIFDDNYLVTISNDVKESLQIVNSNDERYNKIYKKKTDNSKSFDNILFDISGAITYFINGCSMLAINYCNYYNMNKKDSDDKMRIDDAISSVVNAFNIRDKYLQYIFNSILNRGITKYNNTTKIKTDIYDFGFRYFELNDSMDNSLSTIISMYELCDTPETFMLKVCEKAHVIGLSATSTMQTVIGNYDLNFLKDNLSDNFYNPSTAENEEILKYINSRLDTNKSKIKVMAIDSNDINESCEKLFSKDLNIEILNNKEEKYNKYDNKNRIYYFKRFLKVSIAIKNFILSNEKSMLILCNRNLKQNDLYSEDTFTWLIEKICNENNVENNYQIIHLITRNFEEERKKYQNYIKKGKKVIIFSSYPTTGAGQNLQYEYEENDILIKEDIQSLYVENPTNILVNTNNFDPTTNADLIKYIFQVESLKANGEISQKDKTICIKEGFLRLTNPKSYNSHSSLYDTLSTRNQALSILIQAVGRICRTKGKKKDTNIYLDNDILALDLESLKDRRLNKEFTEIINYCHDFNVNLVKNNTNINIQQAINRNKDINIYIQSLVNRKSWTEENIELWKDLREFVLKYPTISNELLSNSRFKKIYLNSKDRAINKYYYHELNDFQNVTISLFGDKDNDKLVSSEDCNLDKLMKIGFIKTFFESKGYATKFDDNNYIILPVIFNNIYKGALGETVGKYIIKTCLNIDLEEIDDNEKFEKFDFKYKNIYIDFKNWNNNGKKLNKAHIIEKSKQIESFKGIIINLFGNENEKITEFSNIIVIPSLIDLNKNKICFKALEKLREVFNSAE